MRIRRRGAWLTGAALAVAVVLTALNGASAAVAISIVTPVDMQGWSFVDEGGKGGSAALVPGPAASGAGSAQFALTHPQQRLALAGPIWAGARFDNLEILSYSTLRQAGPGAIALELPVDYDLNDGFTGPQGRLVFDPQRNGGTVTGAWQTWNAIGGWWYATGAPGTTVCPASQPCTWGQLISAFPNIGIHPAGGAVFTAGPGAKGFIGNVDAFVIGTKGTVILDELGNPVGALPGSQLTVDFEPGAVGPPPPPPPAPADKDQCKDGGWATFTSPSFKNQGQCVSYMARGGTG